MSKAIDQDTARLRLAAKTLVEWRTPTWSPQYREVMQELIGVNKAARGLGLTSSHPLLSIDERGSLLWYLSDTLEDDFMPIPLNRSDLAMWNHHLETIAEIFKRAADDADI